MHRSSVTEGQQDIHHKRADAQTSGTYVHAGAARGNGLGRTAVAAQATDKEREGKGKIVLSEAFAMTGRTNTGSAALGAEVLHFMRGPNLLDWLV